MLHQSFKSKWIPDRASRDRTTSQPHPLRKCPSIPGHFSYFTYVIVGMMLVVAAGPGCRPGAPPPPPNPTAAATLPGVATLPPAPEQLRSDLVPFFTLIQKSDYGAARIRLKKHLTLNADDGQAAFLFGLTHQRERDYAKARPWFEQAVRDAPAYDATYYFYGTALTYLGEPDLARKAFAHHLHFNPESGDSILGVARLDLEAGDVEAAEPRFRRALELLAGNEMRTADRSDAHLELARILRDRDELADARVNLEQALRINPQNAEAWFTLAQICRRLDDRDCAATAQQRHEDLQSRPAAD